MTACVTEDAAKPDARPDPTALTIAADGSYAARLAWHESSGKWFPERWTLAGPEPYAVPLPGRRPEEADTRLLPLADGRVLIRRRAADRHALGLLYPTGPGTGELPLGTVEAAELALLPAAPCGSRAYALAPGARSTVLWLVHDGRHSRPRPGAHRPHLRRRDRGPLHGRRLAGPYGTAAGAGPGAGRPHQDGGGRPGARRRGEPAAPDHRGEQRPAAAGRSGQRPAGAAVGRGGARPAGLGCSAARCRCASRSACGCRTPRSGRSPCSRGRRSRRRAARWRSGSTP